VSFWIPVRLLAHGFAVLAYGKRSQALGFARRRISSKEEREKGPGDGKWEDGIAG
jgi:hypothetical protein